MNYKKEKFQVAGVSHYSDGIIDKIAYDNDDYSLSTDELSEIYDIGDRVFEYSFDDCNVSLVPEPTNEYDPNAVRVEVGSVLIGYIKRGSCSHVKNLLKSPDFDHVEVEIGGGKYKHLYEDDDKIKVEKDSCGFFADVFIYTRQDESSLTSVPSPAAPPVKHDVPFASSATASGSRKKSGAASVLMIIFGILFVMGGFGSLSTSVSSAFVGFVLGGVLLYFGIKKRRTPKQ